jgi:DNA-binding NarL/FixJ family response regulator
MASKSLDVYVHEQECNSIREHKMELAVREFLAFFSFTRASLFAYSPLNWIGEGLLRVDPHGVVSIKHIREDVRDIPPVYSAVTNARVEFVFNADEAGVFPKRYVHQFQLSSLIIVPILHSETVIGCVIADQYKGSNPIEEKLLESMLSFGRVLGKSIIHQHKPKVQKLLSRRELEVMERMSKGEGIKEMADQMGISEYTVRDYVSSALKKLDAKHRAQGVAQVIRMGLIS